MNIHMPFNQAILLLGIYPRGKKKKKAYVYTEAYTQIFITNIFVTPENWKQPSIHQRVKKETNPDVAIQ